MISCTQCGFQNLDDDSFCGSCGGFLEWTGERSTPPPATDEVPPASAPKRSLLSRVQTVLSLDIHAPDAGEEPPSGPPPSGGPPPSRPPARPPSGGPPARPPSGGPPSGGPPSGGPPSGGPPSRPPSGGPPSGGPPSRPPAVPGSSGPLPGDSLGGADVAGLVAPGATAPRSVARTTIPDGNVPAVTPPSARPAMPAAGPAAGSGGTDAVMPQAPVARAKPARQAPSRKLLPGDLVCGECGEGNPPARNFCRRCGATLRDATVVKRRWWQRFLPRRRTRTLEAGHRPWKSSDGTQKQRRKGGRLARVFAKVRPIAAAVLLIAGLLIGFSPNLRERVTGPVGGARDSMMSWIRPTYVPLSPVDITATTEQLDHPVRNVVDGNVLSYWVAPASHREPALVVRFDEPFDLERIKVWNGSAEGFKDRERARELHFVFDNGQSFDLEIKDLPNGEEYSIDGGDGVSEIEIHVTETYISLTSDDLGMSEIEFYFRR